MFYNFRTCYNTVSNMRRYEHKCHFKIIIFYSIYSLFSQYLIQRFLSLLTVFSLSNPCSFSLSSSDHSPSPSNQRYGSLTDQRYAITSLSDILIALSPRRSRVCGFVPMVNVDVGLCRWWVWDVGLFGLVDVGLCRSFWLFVLVDVGLCWWWLLVLLRQWLLCCCCCC